MKIKETVSIISLPVIVASLCCLAPVVLVLLGLSTVTFAASLSDTLYGQYKWLFRLVGLVLLLISTYIYLRKKKNICTIDEAIKRRNEIVNIISVTIITGIVGYIIWLYVIVELIGLFLGIWGL